VLDLTPPNVLRAAPAAAPVVWETGAAAAHAAGAASRVEHWIHCIGLSERSRCDLTDSSIQILHAKRNSCIHSAAKTFAQHVRMTKLLRPGERLDLELRECPLDATRVVQQVRF
jgi:hypothetical protein